ncbi:MAG: hypothetical protein LBE74_04245 [Treponema sp.]|jgi:hypothetical protein|nr:hypothetical protein [Treponema sp.]
MTLKTGYEKGDGEVAEERIAWHPAFFEAIRLELEEYEHILEFYPEHQLTKEPLRLDVLVIKKAVDMAIEKNIAHIFRKDNIVEYKSPEDYLSVYDFYKVYGYACFYAADRRLAMTDLSITFVETRRPREVIKHLEQERGYRVRERESGIYEVEGDIIPIQIIESKRLSGAENIWFKNLTNEIDEADASAVYRASVGRGKENIPRAYLDVIFRANPKIMREVEVMSRETLNEVLGELGFIAEWEARGEARMLALLKSGKSAEEILQMYEGKNAQQTHDKDR